MKKKNIILIIITVVALIMVGSSVILLLLPNDDKHELDDNKETVDNEIYYIITNDGNMKTNNSEMLHTDKVKEGLYFTDINFDMIDGVAALTANVENKSGIDQEQKSYVLVFIDKKDKVLGKIPLSVPSLKVDEKNVILSETQLDVINAYNFRIEDR